MANIRIIGRALTWYDGCVGAHRMVWKNRSVMKVSIAIHSAFGIGCAGSGALLRLMIE